MEETRAKQATLALTTGTKTTTHQQDGQERVGRQAGGLAPVQGGVDPGARGAPPGPQEHEVGGAVRQDGLGVVLGRLGVGLLGSDYQGRWRGL